MKQNDRDINTYLEIVKKKIPNFNDRKVQVFDDGWDFVVIAVDNGRAFRFPIREDYAKKLPIETKFLKTGENFMGTVRRLLILSTLWN